jgi:hypothetical protein
MKEIIVDRIEWLSRLLEMIPVSRRVDYRCFLAAPWRIDYEQSQSDADLSALGARPRTARKATQTQF